MNTLDQRSRNRLVAQHNFITMVIVDRPNFAVHRKALAPLYRRASWHDDPFTRSGTFKQTFIVHRTAVYITLNVANA